MSEAALILCGGGSRRMGTDKAALPFGDSTLLECVVAAVSAVVDEVWLVAREGQELPHALAHLPVARDAAEGRGPLAGLAVGLAAMRAERAFLTACDVPLLQPAFVQRLFDLATGHRAAVPEIGGHIMTTAAVYGADLRPAAERLLAAGQLRPRLLCREPGVRIVGEAELRDVDPDLRSLHDCDTPEDYREALRLAGHRVPDSPIFPGEPGHEGGEE